MPRISGINIPENKRIEVSLTYLYGIGPTRSNLILDTAGIDKDKRAKELSRDEVSKIQNIIIKNYKVEGDLRREVGENIKRLKEVGTWRGSRHTRNLPVKGRTKTNARTNRGVRKTMGSGRKPSSQKT